MRHSYRQLPAIDNIVPVSWQIPDSRTAGSGIDGKVVDQSELKGALGGEDLDLGQTDRRWLVG